MSKKTSLFRYVGAFLLLIIAGYLSNSGPAAADSYLAQSAAVGPLTADLTGDIDGGSSSAEVGDTLLFQATLTGADTVTDLAFRLEADSAITLSSDFDTAPIAYDDVYALPADLLVEIGAADGLLAAENPASVIMKQTLAADQDFDATPNVSVEPATLTLANGTLDLKADGSFVYQMASAQSGYSETFNYTLIDNEGNRATGAVTLTFEQEQVIFVDNQSLTAGNGSLSAPFQTLDAALIAADAECDVIFLFASPQPYDVDHVELLACQKLIGQDYAPYAFGELSDLENVTVPEPTADNRPTIRCAQEVDYLTGVDPSEFYPTTNQGCVEAGQNSVVGGINIINPNGIQKAVAAENFGTIWGFNIGALNSDGLSLSCNDATAHSARLNNITVNNYGYVGIDVVSFVDPRPGDCLLDVDISDGTVTDAQEGAQEALYAFAQGHTQLNLTLDRFEASNIIESAVRLTAGHSASAEFNVSNVTLTDFGKAGIYIENYVFEPASNDMGMVKASVTQSTLEPNQNGVGIMVNHQGSVASDLTITGNTVGQTGRDSGGILIYGENDGPISVDLAHNVVLSRVPAQTNHPSNFTHTPKSPFYFETNSADAEGCIAVEGNRAPAGFDHVSGNSTASLILQVGVDARLRVAGWNGQNNQQGVLDFVNGQNPDLKGETAIDLFDRGTLAGGECDAVTVSQNLVQAEAADPALNIPILPAGKSLIVNMSGVVNAEADGLDRVSAQGVYTVAGDPAEFTTVDPNPAAGFEDPNGRTVIPITEIIVPTLIVSDLTVQEDSGTATVGLSLSEPSAENVVIGYELVAGTATAGSDFADISGELTFFAGSQTASFNVAILNDNVLEADETFTVKFSAAAGDVLIPDGEITISIQDDDVLIVPNASAADVAVDEADGFATVQIVLDQAASQAVVINYETFDEVAQSPADYGSASGDLTIPAGTASASFQIPIVDDDAAELSEYFFVRFTTAMTDAVKIKNPEMVVTINDNDEILIVAGNADGRAVRVVEDEAVARVDVWLSRPSAAEVKVFYMTQNLLAMGGEDYAESPLTTLVFAPGQVRKTIEIPIIDDTIGAEGLERFRLNLSNPENAEIFGNGFAEVVIVDNDNSLPWLYFEFADYGIYEDMDGNPATPSELEVKVMLSNPAAVDVIVNVVSNNGTAVAPGDFAAVNETVTISAGQREATVMVSVNEDNLSERQENFRLIFGSPPAGVIVDPTQNSATVTIADGTPPVISTSQQAIRRSSLGEANQMLFRISLEGNVVLPVRFGLQTSLADGPLQSRLASAVRDSLRHYSLDPGTSTFDLYLELESLSGVSAAEVEDASFKADLTDINGATSHRRSTEVTITSRPFVIYLPIVGN